MMASMTLRNQHAAAVWIEQAANSFCTIRMRLEQQSTVIPDERSVLCQYHAIGDAQSDAADADTFEPEIVSLPISTNESHMAPSWQRQTTDPHQTAGQSFPLKGTRSMLAADRSS